MISPSNAVQNNMSLNYKFKEVQQVLASFGDYINAFKNTVFFKKLKRICALALG